MRRPRQRDGDDASEPEPPEVPNEPVPGMTRALAPPGQQLKPAGIGRLLRSIVEDVEALADQHVGIMADRRRCNPLYGIPVRSSRPRSGTLLMRRTANRTGWARMGGPAVADANQPSGPNLATTAGNRAR